MAVTVTHLLDRETPEDALRLIDLLVRLTPRERVRHRVVALGPPPASLSLPPDVWLASVPVRFDWPMLSLPALKRVLRAEPAEVLHALGTQAAAVAGGLRNAGAAIPVLATLTDPAEADRAARWWRSLQSAGAPVELLCSSSMVQRRLVEKGVPLHAMAVVRPGVDFSELNAARRNSSRESSLGRSPHAETAATVGGETAATGGGRCSRKCGPVLVVPSPPTRAGGQFLGVWAVAILHQLWPDVRLLIPGCSREADRIARLLREIYCPQAFVMTGGCSSPAELLAVSDALIVPAVDNIPTGWLAWAMAAGVPVIGSAVPAVTEFIADRHNGFLCKPGEPHTLAIRIRMAFEAADQMRQCAEVARGQAYDVFRAQQCVEQYTAAFTSLAAGRPAVGAVRDAAVAS